MTSLREAIEEAAMLAETAPTPFRVAAFQEVLSVLLATREGTGRRLPQLGNERAPLALARGNHIRGGRSGPKAAVETALSEGFLNTPRTVGELRTYLRTQGWTYQSKELAMGTLRLVREGSLKRVGGRQGRYQYVRTALVQSPLLIDGSPS